MFSTFDRVTLGSILLLSSLSGNDMFIISHLCRQCKRKRKTPDGGQMSLSKMNFENLFADPVFDYIITHNALIIKISVSADLDDSVKRRLVFSVDAVAAVV